MVPTKLSLAVSARPPSGRRAHGQPHVEHLHAAVRRQHQVGRLDVSMHQSLLVSVLQAEGGLSDDLASVGDGQGLSVPDQSDDVPAGHELHDEKGTPSATPASVAWTRLGCSSRPAAWASREPGQCVRVASPSGRQHLQRDDPVQPRVQRGTPCPCLPGPVVPGGGIPAIARGREIVRACEKHPKFRVRYPAFHTRAAQLCDQRVGNPLQRSRRLLAKGAMVQVCDHRVSRAIGKLA
jgi:hypothetical protein